MTTISLNFLKLKLAIKKNSLFIFIYKIKLQAFNCNALFYIHASKLFKIEMIIMTRCYNNSLC